MSDPNELSDEPTEAESGVKMSFDDVPVPVPEARNASVAFYPLDDLMPPGQPKSSIVIEGRKASQLGPSVARAKRRWPDRDFVVRNLVPTDADPRVGCRVWRTK